MTAIPRWQEAYRMHQGGMTQKEIAARLGVSQPRVSQLIRKAKQYELAEQGITPSDQGKWDLALPSRAIGPYPTLGVIPIRAVTVPFGRLPEQQATRWRVARTLEKGECDCYFIAPLISKKDHRWASKKVVPNQGLGEKDCPQHGWEHISKYRKRVEKDGLETTWYGVAESPRTQSSMSEYARRHGHAPYIASVRNTGLRLIIAPINLAPQKRRLRDGSRGYIMREAITSDVLNGFGARLEEVEIEERRLAVRRWSLKAADYESECFSVGIPVKDSRVRQAVERRLGIEFGDELTSAQIVRAAELWEEERMKVDE